MIRGVKKQGTLLKIAKTVKFQFSLLFWTPWGQRKHLKIFQKYFLNSYMWLLIE